MNTHLAAWRDGQAVSAFALILARLTRGCTGGIAAALVDSEGECVDHGSGALMLAAGKNLAPGALMAAFDIKLAAAHWQIVMRDAANTEALFGGANELSVEGTHYSYVIRTLPEGYVLMLVCRPGTNWLASRHALRQCEVEICLEAGLDLPRPQEPAWTRVRVRVDGNRLPRAVLLDEIWHPVRDLGQHEKNDAGEWYFDVSAADASVHRLVREATGEWFVASRIGEAPLRASTPLG